MDGNAKPTTLRARSSVLVKMALFVATLLILTTGLTSWAGYVVARNIIRDQIHERLRVAASDRHEMVLSFVAQQLERAGLVASRTKLRDLIAQFANGELSEQEMRDGTRPILEDARRGSDGFRVISIADAAGRVITSTHDDRLDTNLSADPAFQAGLTDRHLGATVPAGSGFVTTVACPAVTNDGERLGVVMVELDVSRLFEILNRTDGLGETGEILIGSRDGRNVRYLFAPRSSSEPTVLDDVPAMAAAIGGASHSEVTEYAGVEVLVHYRPIEYQPLDYRAWGLVAKMSVAEAYAPLDEFRRTRLWLQAGLMIVGLAGSLWLSRRLTRPIRELTDTATAVAGGDLSVQVAVSTDDEIGTLGHTFNAMTRQLQSSYATLEDRVRQRTAELSSEITRREAIQQELRQNADRIARIIETANDAFISMDEDGRIVEWNPQAQAMFGWSRDEVLMQSLAETIVPEAFRDDHQTGLQRFLKTREARVLNRRLELTALRRDGSEFPVEITITPQRLGDAFVFNAFLHDITQRKEDERTLHEARESAESANRSKSEFLANMSHEIRTPMNGIIGMGEVLANTKLDREQRDYLGLIHESADSLLHLLNDILDFSKIEAGRLELEEIAFSLRDCVGKTGQTLAVRAAAKGLELACRIAPELPDTLQGDPGRLRQVIVNLAGNAIKFTEQGEVVVNVELESRDDTRVCIKVSVRDTGIGIPRDKQKLVFESFSQADTSTTREFGGTGLGLAISSQLVEMMQGRIWLDSEVGKGTTFNFTAHLGVLPDAPDHTPAQLTSLAGLPVLIVDDNTTNRRILDEILCTWGLSPLSVTNGASALQELRRAAADGHPYQLVLLDMMMPGMDGFELAERVRRDPDIATVTLIMISSAAQAGDAGRCRDVGIEHYMTKPVLQSDLLNVILDLTGEPVVKEMLASAPATDPHRSKLRILLAEDGLVNQRVAIGLVEKRGDEIVVAQNGREAVAAIREGRFDLILMDVQMPEMGGIEATIAIREWERTSGTRTPIVAMTAAAMKGDREMCLDAGMDDYLSKPVKAKELYRLLDEITSKHQTASKHQTDGDSKPDSNAIPDSRPVRTPDRNDVTPRWTSDVFDPAIAAEQIAGGDDGIRDVAALLIEEQPRLMREIRDALSAADATRLQRAAHTLKGSADVFGAKRVVEMARTVEKLADEDKLDEAHEAVAALEPALAAFTAALNAYIGAET